MVFATIMILTEFLSATALGALLQLDIDDLTFTLAGVQSILIIPDDVNTPIRLVHTSLRDFLVSKERSQEFFIDPPSRHLFIAHNCFKILANRVVKVFWDNPWEKYACRNWCYHLLNVLSSSKDNRSFDLQVWKPLIKLLTDFMSRSFDVWVNTILLYSNFGANQTEESELMVKLQDNLEEVPNFMPEFRRLITQIKDCLDSDWKQFKVTKLFLYVFWH